MERVQAGAMRGDDTHEAASASEVAIDRRKGDGARNT